MNLPSIQIPTHNVFIPSLNKMIKFRPYTVKEEKILLMATQSEDPEEILKTTLQICLGCVLQDVDVSELPIFDLEKLIIAIRSKSVGEEVSCLLRCPHCDSGTEMKINIENIKREEYSDVEYKMMLDDNVGVELSFPSVQKTGIKKMVSMENDSFYVLDSCIDTVFDQDSVYVFRDQSEEDRKEFIDNMPITTLQEITDKFLNKIPSNVVEVKLCLSVMRKANRKRVPSLLDFFI